MKRHEKYAFAFFIAAGIYVGLLAALNIPAYHDLILNMLELKITITDYHVDQFRHVFHAVPWFTLVSVGCYCMYQLGMDLLVYRDRPEEIQKLAEVNIFPTNGSIYFFNFFFFLLFSFSKFPDNF